MPRYQLRASIGILSVVFAVVGAGALAAPTTRQYTNVGLLGVTVTNLGYIGHAFDPGYRSLPSGEYPLGSHVEHIYRGGLWVGGRTTDGKVHVTTGAQDANGLQEGDEIREFVDYSSDLDPDGRYVTTVWSNRQNDDNYNPRAEATQQINTFFHDYTRPESGTHTPLGLHVAMKTLAWSDRQFDDFIVIEYDITNISGRELRDVYLGFWIDTTVGNTLISNPYDREATNRWNYYDDQNGAWGPRGLVPDDYAPPDPNIWMAWEHDEDGDDGQATSWIGYRLLGTEPPIDAPAEGRPVSYNQWSFRGVPTADDWYYEGGDTNSARLPGKYQIMSNQEFDVGETQEENFARAGNWVSILSTGPFRVVGPDETVKMTWAIVAGRDSLNLLANSRVVAGIYGDGFTVPAGPPSPRLESAEYRDNAVVLRWAPGDSLDAQGDPLKPDDPARSPEHHISDTTRKPDFQGYRVYRYQGDVVTGDIYELADVVAEFDKIDGIGFDVGLPPLNDDGLRQFIDTNLKEGFPYKYSVTSFSAPDYEFGETAHESGFNENAVLLFPGPAPVASGSERAIGVYPNPYRAASLFDTRAGDPELNRKIWFTNLPARCTIQIFTLAGNLVRTLEHDDPGSGQEPWDLLSGPERAIASGLYIYVVRNLDTDEVQRGKLVIIK